MNHVGIEARDDPSKNL